MRLAKIVMLLLFVGLLQLVISQIANSNGGILAVITREVKR